MGSIKIDRSLAFGTAAVTGLAGDGRFETGHRFGARRTSFLVIGLDPRLSAEGSTMNGVLRLASLSLVAALNSIAARNAVAQSAATPPRGAAERPAASPAFTEEREAAAQVFLRNNAPELLPVLRDLAARNRPEYERAMRDFFQTSERLAEIRQRDPQQYALALRNTQAEMRVNLLAAQLARRPENEERVREELEKAVQVLVQLRIEQASLQILRLEQTLSEVRRQKEHVESNRQQLVQDRLQAILAAVEKQRAHADSSRPREPAK
jgi:hypothetical protein